MTVSLRRGIVGILFLALMSAPAFAQGGGDSNGWLQVLQQPMTIIYLVIAAIVAYLFSGVFTMLTARIGYPPNMARLGCWLGGVLWLGGAALLFWQLWHTPLPMIALIIIAVIIVFVGVVLLVTKRNPEG